MHLVLRPDVNKIILGCQFKVGELKFSLNYSFLEDPMLIEFPNEKVRVEEKKISSIFWENKLKVGSVIFAALLVGAFTLKTTLQKRTLLKDFFLANGELHSLQKEGEVDEEVVSNVLVHHPELTPLFQHVLVDQKIFQGEVDSAKALTMDSLQRMDFIDPFYNEYTKSSIMIEEGRYAAALNETINTVEKIRLSGSEAYPHIYTFSLLRVGMLSLITGETERAKEAFKEVKELLLGKEEKLSSEARNQLISHLNADRLSFFDFVEKELGE